MAELKLLPQIADLSMKLQSRGPNPMTKIEAFRQAVAEMGDAGSQEMSAFIERKFGIVISPLYIPLFQATLRFQRCGISPEKPKESSCLPSVK